MRSARSTLIGTAVAVALFGPEAVVHAQTSSSQNLQEVVVTGIRASLEKSLEQKRAADSVEEVITSEDVGKMPDKNIADSLKRVAGVTISSAGATEGGFDENDRISLRGTGPSLTQTLLNGHNVSSGDWFVLNQVSTVGRSVSYTLLPSELVSKVVIHKSSEASLVEGGVAGTVDIITRRSLDFIKPFTFEGSAGAVYADLPSKTDPQLSALVNWRNDESNFGVLLQGFYERRHLRRDGVELLGYDTISPTSWLVTGQADPANGVAAGTPHPDLAGVQYPTVIGAAFFEQERKRAGGLIDAQFKPNDDVNLDLSGFYSKLDGPNYNRNYLLWNTHYINSGNILHTPNPTPDQYPAVPSAGYVIANNTLVVANFAPLANRAFGIYDQISRPDESASSNFVNLDGAFRISDRLNLLSQVGFSEGHGKTPTQNVSETLPGVGNGAGWQLNGIGSGTNFNLASTNNTVPFPAGNPSALAFGWIFGAQNVDVVDKETWGKLDASFAMADNGPWKDLKFGVRYVKHDRTSDKAIAQGPTGGTNPSTYPTSYSNYPSNFNTFGGSIPTGVWYWTPAQLAVYNGPGQVNRDPLAREYYQFLYQVHEKDLATYLQADFKGSDWAGNLGVRVVNTDENIVTYTQVNAATPGAILTSAFGPFIGLPVSHTYSDFLPSANLKIDMTPEVVARFAVSQTMTRADYSALAGNTNLVPPGAITGVGSGSGGNPDLKPIRSTNYDAGLEWYFAKRSLLSGTVFYMDLQNYVGFGSQILSYLTYGPAPTYPPNGALVQYNLTVPVDTKGRVQGIELTYQQALGDHFGLEGNYTYTDGRQTEDVPQGGDDRLVGTSKNTYNVGAYYEDPHFSAHVTYNYRSAFFSGLDRSTAFSQDDIGTLAASVAYAYNENLSVNLDGQNLNDPTLKYYALNTTQPRAFYRNGRQFYLSVRAKF
ncbi:MAG: TonB-dependent receptor [Bacillati bacterium ANGP1]|uniref:TonB-dependent receptor n=1 Tax=Candidatus Segetimicrobium genomatis TaxID=2569760 RepID=A0A537JSX1_9BACT|nr:MAG: TonB-dependent receptor [Terrabacteria group bacterium ANGP1]